MPHSCFSYSADLPLDRRNRNAAQPAPRQSPGGVGTICFNYPADMPVGVRNRSAAQPMQRDLASISGGRPDFTTTICFSYGTNSACFRS